MHISSNTYPQILTSTMRRSFLKFLWPACYTDIVLANMNAECSTYNLKSDLFNISTDKVSGVRPLEARGVKL